MIQRPAPPSDRGRKTGAVLVECLVVVVLLAVLGGVVVFVVDGMTG
jgi:Tfp pilus assembly protein FimT